MNFRQRNSTRLEQFSRDDVEVVILGGGINGVSVLRELALCNCSVMLLDTNDFCYGATGASTRMAHGGLRYLENREIKLVREALRERDALLKSAPHLVLPLKINVPLESYVRGFLNTVLGFAGLRIGRTKLNALSVRCALFLYEYLSRSTKVLPRHQFSWSRSKLKKQLNVRFKAMAHYHDARFTHPEALHMEVLEDALASSSRVAALNYINWHLQESGEIKIVDKLSNTTYSLKPQVIINATGAWVDYVNQQLGMRTRYVNPVKGSHIVVKSQKLLDWLDGEAYYYPNIDGRMVVCYPLEQSVLMGTTELAITNPSFAEVTHPEIDYLLEALNRLISTIELTQQDIVCATTGCRPLVASDGSDINSARRDHVLFQNQNSLGFHVVSVVGGKWTTFRAIGECAGKQVLHILGKSHNISTINRPYKGNMNSSNSELQIDRLAHEYNVNKACLKRWYIRYGEIRCNDLLEHALIRENAPLVYLPDYTQAEITWLAENRAVVSLQDLVLRRTQIALNGKADKQVLEELATILAGSLGHDSRWIESEVIKNLSNPAVNWQTANQ